MTNENTPLSSNQCNCPNGSYGQKHTAACYEAQIERLRKALDAALQGACRSDAMRAADAEDRYCPDGEPHRWLKFTGGERCSRAGCGAERLSHETSGWRPIETAPKGGRWVLLAWPAVTDVPFVGYRQEGVWRAATNGDHWADMQGPTHWMPLPAMPSKKAGETSKSPQAPIAKLTVWENLNGMCCRAELYAPGLPAGEHDLYCEPTDLVPPLKASERCQAKWVVANGIEIYCRLEAGHSGKHMAPEPFSNEEPK